MSDDQFDDFKKHMRQVFDNHQDNTADEGWRLLREKYPEEEKDRPAAWLWRMAGVAALLLAFLGAGLWFNFRSANKPVLTAKHIVAKRDSSSLIAQNNEQVSGSAASTAADHKPVTTVNSSSANINHTLLTSANKQYHAQQPYQAANINTNTRGSNSAADSNLNKAFAYNLANKAKSPTITQTPVAAANNNPSGTDTGLVKTAQKDQVVMVPKHDKSIQSLFDNDKYQSTPNTDVKIKYKTVTFAIYAATYLNYAKGSSKELSAGGGLTTDIRLNDNLSLSTGIALAQNNLAYSNNNSSSTEALFSSPASLSHQYTTSQAAFVELSPASQNLDASLVNLDVPVNLKYVFNAQKKNLYMLAGFSSGAFVDETYKYTNSYNIPNSSPATQSQQENSNKAFDSFYFAKMLNFAFGLGYPLGKSQLVIEPFFKYPINGLGEQHILFGSGGVNLKINLDAPKK